MTPRRAVLPLMLLCALLALAAAPAPAAARGFHFSLPTAAGDHIDLRAFRGRVVVVDFFATYCRPCKSSWPRLNRMLRHFDNRGLSVIAYSVDRPRDRKKVLPYAVQHVINFPVVLGSTAQAKRLAQVDRLPTTVVLDPQGHMVARFAGVVSEQKLLAAIYPYLNRGAPPQPEVGQVSRRRPEDKRIKRVWVTQAEGRARDKGFYLHVEAEVMDLAVEQGLWLAAYFQPEAKTAGGLAALGQPKPLYMLIKRAMQQYFILYVAYSQLPPVPKDGVHRLWVELLGPDKKPLEASGELVFDFHLAQIQGQ